jgi:cytochrome c biogenesis protein CcmG/thiol:disulfide interchange protein DsbE
MTLDRRRLLMLTPLALSAVIGASFWEMLARMSAGKFDPHAINNPLLNNPLPVFSAPGIGDHQGFDTAALRAAAAQKPVLVNFFWSQCIPCMQEADILGSMAVTGLPIWGIVWKDTAAGVAKYLGRFGNPYQRIADDHDGRVSIDWGVDGYPESFLVDRAGVVRWHASGPMTAEMVRDELLPALKATA